MDTRKTLGSAGIAIAAGCPIGFMARGWLASENLVTRGQLIQVILLAAFFVVGLPSLPWILFLRARWSRRTMRILGVTMLVSTAALYVPTSVALINPDDGLEALGFQAAAWVNIAIVSAGGTVERLLARR